MRLPRRPRRIDGPKRARRPRSAPLQLRPRSSTGCRGIPRAGSRSSSPGRATSSSTASPRRIPRPSSSRSPKRRSPPASASRRPRMAVETRGKRLPPEIFDLPVDKIREGYYTDEYFNRTRQVLLEDGRQPRVVMQVFQKKAAILAGIDEAIAVLKLGSDEWEDLTVHALYEGDEIQPWESVMTIEGDYTAFAHLETVYLGVLARRTMIAT